MDDIASRLLRLPQDTRTCLAFFTRLPVAAPAMFDLRAAAAALPVVGLVIGALGALVLVVAHELALPPFVCATFAVATLVAVCGGLHEDGLADTADGLGGRTVEARLSIMRDSRIGTFGVLAVGLTLLVRTSALAALSARPGLAAAALLLVALLSRVLAMWHWYDLPPARFDGLARQAGSPDRPALIIATASAVLAAILALWLFGRPALLASVLAVAGVWLLSRTCRRTIRGHTGDTIGAAQQVAESLLLAGLSSGWWSA